MWSFHMASRSTPSANSEKSQLSKAAAISCSAVSNETEGFAVASQKQVFSTTSMISLALIFARTGANFSRDMLLEACKILHLKTQNY